MKFNEDGFTAQFSRIVEYIITPLYIESALDEGQKILVNALWDTGANKSVIRPEIVEKLNMKCISLGEMGGISGKSNLCGVYFVNIHFPNKKIMKDVCIIENYPPTCEVLIGMDVISKGDFAISNYNGKTTFTFRSPSLSELCFCEHNYILPDENKS